MKWYIDRIAELKAAGPVYSVCGDDCAVCPRYLARTEEELHETALFWQRAGWRETVVSNAEIRCGGCGSRGSCAFMLLDCTREHGVSRCRDCGCFECDRVRSTYEKSGLKQAQCRAACESDEEYTMLCRAFYEKEKNMRKE